MQDYRISFMDNQKKNFKDKFSSGNNDGIHGKVRIFEHKIAGSDKKLYLLHETDNLIVYRGRRWLLQRAFNWNDPTHVDNMTPIDTSPITKSINLFAIGTGGCATGAPLNVIAPALTDLSLTTWGTIGSGSRYIVASDSKEYHFFDQVSPLAAANFPYVIYDDDADIPTSSWDTANNFDNYLIAQIQVTLETDEANGSSYQDINEAGLFYSSYNINTGVGSLSEQPRLFSHVTFPTIRKDNTRRIIFQWLVYF